jgi:probable rRNA maturation factor
VGAGLASWGAEGRTWSGTTVGSMDEGEQSSSVDVRGLPARLRSLKGVLRRAARQALLDHQVESYALSLSFVDDERISRLNKEFLGRSGPTDVIAFDLSEKGLPFERVGDIYVSLDTAQANSKNLGVSLDQELLRLVIHGVLHILGYSDERSPDELRMRKAQEDLVKRFSSTGKS